MQQHGNGVLRQRRQSSTLDPPLGDADGKVTATSLQPMCARSGLIITHVHTHAVSSGGPVRLWDDGHARSIAGC